MAFGRWAADANQLAALKGDAVASLADVANWRFLATHVTYGGVNPFPSPLLHMWSLSIEEQCYLLLPLALLAGWAIGRRRGVAIVVVVLTAGSLAAAWWFAGDPMRIYYGTDVRAAEVLIGALGALAVTTRMAPHLRRVCAVLAPLAIVAIGWSWTVASETSPALAHGGLALHAVGTLIVILALSQPGWLAGAFAVAPLAWLGRISYGVYLYHWPLFLWLTPARTGLSDGWNDVLRVGRDAGAGGAVVLRAGAAHPADAPRPSPDAGARRDGDRGHDDRGPLRHAGTRPRAADRPRRRAAGTASGGRCCCRSDISGGDGRQRSLTGDHGGHGGHGDDGGHRDDVAGGDAGGAGSRCGARPDADPDGAPRRRRSAALRVAGHRRRSTPTPRREGADHPRRRRFRSRVARQRAAAVG